MSATEESAYTISTELSLPYDDAVAAVRAALSDQGFGVLTEIDLASTMKAKLDKEIPRQVILGACWPPLAYEALQADPSVAAFLPCNVVMREVDAGTTRVESFDPQAMLSFSTSQAMARVAADARQRLQATMDALPARRGDTPGSARTARGQES